jgi:hypothetical protein
MFRAYIAGKNGFPDAVTGVKVARGCIEDALAIHLRSGGTVEPGESNRCICISSNNYIPVVLTTFLTKPGDLLLLLG